MKKIILFLTIFIVSKVAAQKSLCSNLAPDKLHQLGETSKDNGASWLTEYDLDCRRKK
ncbi:MAG: hypothetical protein ABJA37_03460 [Ferruginibacter sp.]